jgi:hypothetical protein
MSILGIYAQSVRPRRPPTTKPHPSRDRVSVPLHHNPRGGEILTDGAYSGSCMYAVRMIVIDSGPNRMFIWKGGGRVGVEWNDRVNDSV